MMGAIGYLHVQESGPLWIYHFGWFAVVQAMPCLYDRHLYYIHTVLSSCINCYYSFGCYINLALFYIQLYLGPEL